MARTKTGEAQGGLIHQERKTEGERLRIYVCCGEARNGEKKGKDIRQP